MSVRRHVKVFGVALTTLLVSVVVTSRVAAAGFDGAPALLVLVALVVLGGVVAGSVEPPKWSDAVIIIVMFTLLGWLWRYEYPAGEQSGTDWFSRGGWALLAIAFTAVWLVGAGTYAAATKR